MRKWLKEIRDNRFLTQEEVSKLANISRTHYTRIEAGNNSPSVDVAKRISKVLKFDWVIFFENESSSKEQKQAI